MTNGQRRMHDHRARMQSRPGIFEIRIAAGLGIDGGRNFSADPAIRAQQHCFLRPTHVRGVVGKRSAHRLVAHVGDADMIEEQPRESFHGGRRQIVETGPNDFAGQGAGHRRHGPAPAWLAANAALPF